MYDEENNLGELGFDPIVTPAVVGGGASILAPLIGKIFGDDPEKAQKDAQAAALKQQREATVYNTISAEHTKRTVITALVIGGAILASVTLLYGATKK